MTGNPPCATDIPPSTAPGTANAWDGGVDTLTEATTFLTGPEAPAHPDPAGRLAAVRTEIAERDTYEHTSNELVHGAKLAWRNHARCIGRLHWPSLQVVDRRDATRPAEIFEACVEHLKQATNGGNLNSMITLFAPRRPDGGETRIWNSQLIRYAGYRMSDGSILGDPLNADLTDAVHTLGWQGEGGRFDILPLVIQTPGGEPQLFDLPREEILEVELHHPELPWFSDLGLRWHALPAISDMRMELGGLTYTACPFNGWYVSWEIGARNLSDENRYNLLPLIAERMGLDTRTPKTLWKDRALLELNHAVLHSFDEAGVKMVDHHTAAKQFCTHQDRETATGRITPTDWAWVVPPISGSTAPTFHRTYDNPDLRPNFYHQTPTWH